MNLSRGEVVGQSEEGEERRREGEEGQEEGEERREASFDRQSECNLYCRQVPTILNNSGNLSDRISNKLRLNG